MSQFTMNAFLNLKYIKACCHLLNQFTAMIISLKWIIFGVAGFTLNTEW